MNSAVSAAPGTLSTSRPLRIIPTPGNRHIPINRLIPGKRHLQDNPSAPDSSPIAPSPHIKDISFTTTNGGITNTPNSSEATALQEWR